MGSANMEIGTEEVSPDPLPFARSYQLEAFEMGIKRNTIVFLETGSGKTLIATMLLRSYAYQIRKPSKDIAVFLVPKVVLVKQQAEALEMHTDLKIGMYWGEKGVDNWDKEIWKKEIETYEVFVMTPQILLNNLRHSFFQLTRIKVLVFDECHHARGSHPYANIMLEFYHRYLNFGKTNLPRILGMTASPIKSKGGNSEDSYWRCIKELETNMNSKVYTCASESVLAQFIPFSTPKFKSYRDEKIPFACFAHLAAQLRDLKDKHVLSLKELDLSEQTTESICRRLTKTYESLLFCLDELGVWLAMKAASSFTNNVEADGFTLERVDVLGEAAVKRFSLDALKAFFTLIPTCPNWSIADDNKYNIDEGLLTSKVLCLIDILMEHRNIEDLRCIVFVQRIVSAVVIQSLLSEFLPRYINWTTKYIAGTNHFQAQTRKKQNEIVGEFRQGLVNIIVATSILEEGLDVQSCNLVVQFDPCDTVCSFIQSRGRARKQDSEYILMVKSGDLSTQSRLKNYLSSGEVMRAESLRHASVPCEPVESDLLDYNFYCVESTGAIVTLRSSITLIYFYCSRLPSDGYFKPSPRWDNSTGTLYLPKSCPIQVVTATGHLKILKQIACLEACKQLHQIGALTDNLVPDMVIEEEDNAKELASQPYEDDYPRYSPSEVIDSFGLNDASILYHCYLIELRSDFEYTVQVHDLVLGMRTELESDIANTQFDLTVERGKVSVALKYVGNISLNRQQVLWSRRFQVCILRLLIDKKFDNLREVLNNIKLSETTELDYLLFPGTTFENRPSLIDWDTVTSALFSSEEFYMEHIKCHLRPGVSCRVHTQGDIVCACKLKNSVVYTPHNGRVYCITGILYGMNGNSPMKLRNGEATTYKEYFKVKYGVDLLFCGEPLLLGRELFQVKNFLLSREAKEKESTNTTVELPPELCSIIMSPISLSTMYSFSFFPSIMHRLESLLVAANLRRMQLDPDGSQNVVIPVIKVLEGITTKNCQEMFHLESLETLGDSFLKYAASLNLFKKYQNQHEGMLSIKKEKIISNVALFKRGCERKLPGFIRDECFEPKKWVIPGDTSSNLVLKEDLVSDSNRLYISGRRKIKSKRIADVVEALIGAFLSTGGEIAALKFMNWVGIEIEYRFEPIERNFHLQPEKFINIRSVESLLNYSFRDPSLLLEALTHGSYMLPEIPTCYQRLEFLGDAVLDYLITVHLYNTYPGMSPGMLTDMRSASVNNECYALSTVKHNLHKHILHTSHQLHKEIASTLSSFKTLTMDSTFGWETESAFPKVLGDVIESIAGAIFVDSGYNKEVVFSSIRPLLEPLITPETVKLHPVQELSLLCQKIHFQMEKKKVPGLVTIIVVANGVTYEHSSAVSDKRIAKKVASKMVLKSLKAALNLN